MRRLQFAAMLTVACAGLISLTACGGSSNQISIVLATANGLTTMDESLPSPYPASTLNIMASVGGDTTGKGVTWMFETNQSGCGSSGATQPSCGTLTNASPFSVTFTAPSITSTTTGISVIIEATSTADKNITKTITISIVLPADFATTECNPEGVLPCALANGNNAVPYTAQFTFTGGVSPYTYTLLGSLPPCLKLQTSTTSTTGEIIGTPCNTSTATYSFTIQVTDSGGAAPVSQQFTITVAAPPPLSLTSGPLPPGTVDGTYNGLISAVGGVAPLTFTLTSGSLPPGLSLNGTTGQITGVPIDESAGSPTFYPKNYPFAVQVQDSALPTPQKAPATPAAFVITIQGVQPLALSPTGLPIEVLAEGQTGSSPAYSSTLNATGGVAPYTWSVVQGQLPSGLTLSGNPNGTATISGTPVLVGTSTFTVQVADSEVNPSTGNPAPATALQVYQIQIVAGTLNNSLFSGQYAFLFTGFDSDGPVELIGTLTANGDGLITTGSVDSNRVSGVALGGIIVVKGGTTPPGSSYAMGSDGRGTMELTITFGANANIVADYRLVMDSAGNINFFQDYTTTTTEGVKPPPHGEGILKPVAGVTYQAGTFSGNYVLAFPGYEAGANNPAALLGVVHSNGSTLSPGSIDFNDNGSYSSAGVGGTFQFISGNEGAMQLTFASGATQLTLNFDAYFVSPTDVFFIEDDSSTATGLPTVFRLAGEAILQSTGTVFNQATLAGTSVASGTGIGTGGNASIFAGLLTDTVCNNAAAPVSLSYDENNGGAINGGASTPISFSGACTVASNGRVGFTGLGTTAAATRVAAAYLTGPGTGFLIGSDAAVTTGRLERQTLASFSPKSFFDGYTLSTPYIAEAGVKNVIGQTFADGVGTLSGSIDEIDPTGATAPNLAQPLTATFSSPAPLGRGTLASGSPVPSGFPTSSVFYVVSPASVRIVSEDTSDTHPQLILLDH
jgi:large repetitive protein